MSLAAQQQAMKLLVPQQANKQASNELNMMTQGVVVNIDLTLKRIDELRSLQHHKDRLIKAYGGTIPPVLARDVLSTDIKIQQGYLALSKLIQFANNSIVHFNNSPAACVPHLLNAVSARRHQLNIRLEALKNHKPAAMVTPSSSTSTQGGAQNGSKTKAQQAGSKTGEISSTTQAIKNQPGQQSAAGLTAASSSSRSVGVESSRPTVNHVPTERQPATGQQKPAGQEQPETKTQSSGVVRDASGLGRINSIDQFREKITKRITNDSKEREMRKTAKILLVEKTKAPADSNTSSTSAKQ